MKLTRSGTIDTAKGPADWFTGDVYLDRVEGPAPPARVQAAIVHFTPGARTAWHTHPLGQTLLVTEGVGLCQREGARSRSSAQATPSSSSPVRTTGTAPRRPASWSTSQCRKPTTRAARSAGASTSRTSSTRRADPDGGGRAAAPSGGAGYGTKVRSEPAGAGIRKLPGTFLPGSPLTDSVDWA